MKADTEQQPCECTHRAELWDLAVGVSWTSAFQEGAICIICNRSQAQEDALWLVKTEF